jgi:hypothetical protein
MSNYNTSREPMTMEEFIATATSKGWTLAPKHPGQNVFEINLVDAQGRRIVAYIQPTIHKDHIGFVGSVYGLVEVWEEDTIEQKILEGQDLDEDTTGAEAVEAYDAALAYYDPEPDGADEVRRGLSENAGQQRPTYLMEVDARWGLWTPSAAEKAHFTASRETVEWLCSRRDGEPDQGLAKAFDGLAQKALEVHAEAAEPPLTTAETDMARSIAMFDLEGWTDHDHAEDWMAAGGRKGARDVIAEYEK